MTCSDLAARVEELQPQATPANIARLCLLLINHVDDLEELEGEENLAKAWRDMRVRLEAAGDQHEAMTNELAHLSRKFSGEFTLEDMLVLFRAFKVQNQMLRLYIGNGRWMCGKFPGDR